MYFIIVLRSEDDKNFTSIRTVGFYQKFEDAYNAVINNSCDIFEHTYSYAMIEELSEGLYPINNGRFLFKWNHDLNQYWSCEEIEEMEKFYCYAF